MDRRIWMAALVTALAGMVVSAPAQHVARSAVKPVAEVNGVAISQAELDAVLKASGPVPVHLPAAQRRQRQMEALGLLIDTVLMRQYLEKHTPPVPATEVTRRMSEIKTGLEAQGKSIAEFCNDTNQSEEQLRTSVVDHLRWNAFLARSLSEAAVEQYHRDNKDFFDKVTVQASHIVLRVPEKASPREREEAKAKLAQIRQKLLSEKGDFAEAACKYSQDPRAAQGGELGEFPRKWIFDESFSRAAFALKEGEISDVVETEYGYHLIKVTKRNTGTPSDFAKIKDTVREFCGKYLRQQILAKERKTAKIEINLP